MSETAEVLRKAKALIEREASWIRHEYARNDEGFDASDWSEPPTDFNPNCFCVLGAICTAAVGHPFPDELEEEGDEYARYFPARVAFERAVQTDAVPHWNDDPSRTHAEVMAAFDKAIALAEAQS